MKIVRRKQGIFARRLKVSLDHREEKVLCVFGGVTVLVSRAVGGVGILVDANWVLLVRDVISPQSGCLPHQISFDVCSDVGLEDLLDLGRDVPSVAGRVEHYYVCE